MLLKKAFKAEHFENRMKFEGDVTRAREYFFAGTSPNLRRLLEKRFSWMNNYISEDSIGLEVGCGTGVSKEFIKSKNYSITDFADYPWLDASNIDALNTGYADATFDFVVSSNMIHHVPYPVRFFDEMYRILKPGGVLLIQEINASFFMRLLLRLMRHEGYSFEPNVFDPNLVCTDPNDLWSANCAIPNLLFDDPNKFHSYVPKFRITKQSHSEFFTFINSGGVIAKTFSIPLPLPLIRVAEAVDSMLTMSCPSVFALQRQIVLKKI